VTELKHRNLFEIENARGLTRAELVNTFVDTTDFKRLLSSKNHIVLGERGSGKTALAKMLSHDHLSLLETDYAREIIRNKSFIGIYTSIRTEWVSGLRNKPWQSEKEKERFFQWRLNVATCIAFLRTLRSCLDSYIFDVHQRVLEERQLIEDISDSWSEGARRFQSIVDLQQYLEDIEFLRQQQLARLLAVGVLRDGDELAGLTFDAELFAPLRRGMTLAARKLAFPEESKWLLCLDEAEALDEIHHRILNTHLRTDSGNLVFKITTTPYSHYTQDTNSGAPLIYGDDFEYVYIDSDSVFQNEENVARLFEKRAKLSPYQNISLEDMLGRSKLLSAKGSDWTLESDEMRLLEKYTNRATTIRAKRLLQEDPDGFKDEISRKIHGALLLREAVEAQVGNRKLDIYSGVEMAIKCGDSNPRRLVRIFNSFLMHLPQEGGFNKKPFLSPAKQTQLLLEFSSHALKSSQTLPVCGPRLFQVLKAIGTYMHDFLHKMPLATDIVFSIEIDKDITEPDWTVVERAVQSGYLFPIRNNANPDILPHKEGVFYLAYVLSPYFRLLPRHGHARKYSAVLDYQPLSKRRIEGEMPLFESFDDEGQSL
jgi:hypothetical protein